MRTGLILTGGRLDLAFAGSFLKLHPIDDVVCVDGGLRWTKSLDLNPTAIVGDFDTVDPHILEEYRKDPGILWDVHKPEKDETDTELAIHTAIKLGCRRLYLLGALGGRLDHEWSNIHLLKECMDLGAEAYLFDPQNKVYLLQEGRTFQKDQAYGTYVSFLPFTEEVKGITLTGFKYPLFEKDIHIGKEAGLCVSNEILEQTARIDFKSGILICVESSDWAD